MLNVLNSRTVLLATLLIMPILSLVLVAMWLTRHSHPGFRQWVVGSAAGSLSILLVALDGWIPNALFVISANIFGIVSGCFIYNSLRRFQGRPHHDRLNIVLAVITIVASFFFLYMQDNPRMRIVIYYTCAAVITLRCAATLFNGVNPKLRTGTLITASMFSAYGLLLAFRAVIALLDRPTGTLFNSELIQSALFAGILMASTGWTFGYFLMSSQRIVSDLWTVQGEMHYLISHDTLTNVYNRRQFIDDCQRMFAQVQTQGRQIAIGLIDLDCFKSINDTQGHLAGDEVLKAVANACRANLRKSDRLARIGGDEFAILLPECDIDGTIIIAERLHQSIQAIAIQHGTQTLRVSASIGVTLFDPADTNINSALERADIALYHAKQGGRNRIAAHDGAMRILHGPSSGPALPSNRGKALTP